MLKRESTYQYLQLAALLILPWGMFFSEAVASIAVILFALPCVLYGHRILSDRRLRGCWPYVLFYVIILFSGYWTNNSTKWLDMLRVNLPYLILPLAFYLWPEFLWARRRYILGCFVGAGVALALYVILYFLANPETVLSGLRGGGSFRMPVHHVRSGLFLAIAGVLIWDELIRHRWWSRPMIGCIIALGIIAVGLLLTAVRTGLVLFCVGALVTFLFNKGYHTRKGLSWIGVSCVLAVVAFFLIPTVREKWLYFLEDIQNYDSHSWWFYSDAVRWRSNLIGWQIFRDAPWWGVGLGDLLDEMHLRFYESENIRLLEYPHNLWITFLAGTGLVGFSLLHVAWVGIYRIIRVGGPLVYRIIFLIFLVSCLVENTLLTSLGAIAFILFMLLGSQSERLSEA